MTYDRDRCLRPVPAEGLRLLPWENAEGKPCFLRTDGSGGGLISRFADDIEEAQIRVGAQALTDAETVLDDPTAGPLTLRVALRRTTRALSDTLRIADSRGTRLTNPAPTSQETTPDPE